MSIGAIELPGVGAAGVLARGTGGTLIPIGASVEQHDLLTLLEVGATNPVALGCLATGHPVALERLGTDPNGEDAALAACAAPLGLQSAYALPLSTGAATVGVLHLFGTTPVPQCSLSLGRSLADVATLALLGADPHLDAAVATRRLDLAIEARVTIEQAKGVLAARFGLTPEAAFGQLSAAATTTGRPLGLVATAVVERTTDASLDAALTTPQRTDAWAARTTFTATRYSSRRGGTDPLVRRRDRWPHRRGQPRPQVPARRGRA